VLNPQTSRSTEPVALTSAAGLRVALFSGNYNCTCDGSNRALNKLVGHLLEHGADVRVYSPTSSRPAFDPVGELVSVPSIPIPGRSEFRVALGLPTKIADDVRAFAPNLVHVSAPDWLGTRAQKLARELAVPLVASMHTKFETYFEYYGLRFLHDWAVGRQLRFYCSSDRVLVPNAPSGQHLIDMGVPANRIGIWSRGVEHQLFNPSRRDRAWRRSLGYLDDDVVLLFFGRIVREKGTAQFAETVAELRARGFNVRPLVVGEGPARAEMKTLIDNAVFLGHLAGEELGRAIASADILLNPSLTEAFGNVNLEAMAAGLCVISADVGSASAIITSGKDGLLVNADADSYASTVFRLANDDRRRRRLARNALATAQSYRWPGVLNEVVQAYRELTQIQINRSI